MIFQHYRQVLEAAVAQLTSILEDNLFRQQEVEIEITELRRRSGVQSSSSSHNNTHSEFNGQISRSLAVFLAPYFKDSRGFTHPPNADTLAKKRNGELDTFLTTPKEWNVTEKNKLIRAVKEEALRERMKSFLERRDFLKQEVTMSLQYTPTEKFAMNTEIESISERLREIKLTPDSELFADRFEDFDWLKISAQTVSRLKFCPGCVC